MSAHEPVLACLQNRKAAHAPEGEPLPAELQATTVLRGVEPERVYEYLEEAEARVEHLTRSLYSAMNAYTSIQRRWI
jgi:hypothetical protein